jgi:hypothetical protein
MDVSRAVIVPLMLLPIPFPAAGRNCGLVYPIQSVRFIAERIRPGLRASGGKKNQGESGRRHRKHVPLHENPSQSFNNFNCS